MAPEALRRRMAHGNIYPAERVDAALGNYFRAGQPRRAARARAAVGRRPGRRGARRTTATGTGSTGPGRRASASSSPSPARPTASGSSAAPRAWRARSKGDLIAVHVRPQDGLAAGAAELLERAARAGRGARRHLPRGRRRRHRRGARRDGARASTRPRSCSARPGARAWTELTRGSVDQPRDPRLGRRPRRPRHQPRRRRLGGDEHAAAGARPSALPRRRVAARLRARGASALPLLTWVLTHLREQVGAAERAAPLPAARRRRLRRRRPLAGARRGGRRLPARQLVLHAAAPHVHDRRGRERPRALRLPRGRSRRERASSRSPRGAPPTAPAPAPRRRRCRGSPGLAPVADLLDGLRRALGLDARRRLPPRRRRDWAVEHSAGAPRRRRPRTRRSSLELDARPRARRPSAGPSRRARGQPHPRRLRHASSPPPLELDELEAEARPPRASPPPTSCARRSSRPSRTTCARRSSASRRR